MRHGPKPTQSQLDAAAAKLRGAYNRTGDEARDMASAAAFSGLDFITRDANIEALVIATTRFGFDPDQPQNDTPFLVWASHADNLSPGMIDSLIRGGVLAWMNTLDLSFEQRWDYAKMLFLGEDGVVPNEEEVRRLMTMDGDMPRAIRKKKRGWFGR